MSSPKPKVTAVYQPEFITGLRRLPRIRSRGKFYSTQALIDRVNELVHQGVGLGRVAELCGVTFNTVKRILELDPREVEGLSLPDYAAFYVIITESGVPMDIDPMALEHIPVNMKRPWIQGAAVEESVVSAIRRRVRELGDQYGSLRVAKLVFVDTKTLME